MDDLMRAHAYDEEYMDLLVAAERRYNSSWSGMWWNAARQAGRIICVLLVKCLFLGRDSVIIVVNTLYNILLSPLDAMLTFLYVIASYLEPGRTANGRTGHNEDLIDLHILRQLFWDGSSIGIGNRLMTLQVSRTANEGSTKANEGNGETEATDGFSYLKGTKTEKHSGARQNFSHASQRSVSVASDDDMTLVQGWRNEERTPSRRKRLWQLPGSYLNSVGNNAKADAAIDISDTTTSSEPHRGHRVTKSHEIVRSVLPHVQRHLWGQEGGYQENSNYYPVELAEDYSPSKTAIPDIVQSDKLHGLRSHIHYGRRFIGRS